MAGEQEIGTLNRSLSNRRCPEEFLRDCRASSENRGGETGATFRPLLLPLPVQCAVDFFDHCGDVASAERVDEEDLAADLVE